MFLSRCYRWRIRDTERLRYLLQSTNEQQSQDSVLRLFISRFLMHSTLELLLGTALFKEDTQESPKQQCNEDAES